MLPFELLLLIAETSLPTFVAIRSVHRGIRDYTNLNMNKYKGKFSREITEGGRKYRVLPNGDKHGLYTKYYTKSIIQFDRFTSQIFTIPVSGTYTITFNPKNNGYSEERNGLAERCYYIDNKKTGLYESWYMVNEINQASVPGALETYYIYGTHGRLRCSSNFINDKKHGLYQSWYKDGCPKKKCNYINGKKQGSYQSWHNINGKLEKICRYINGKKVGLYRQYHSNGKLWKKCFYIDGKKIGLSQSWYRVNGQLEIECRYVDGRKNGLYQHWDIDGNIYSREYYDSSDDDEYNIN